MSNQQTPNNETPAQEAARAQAALGMRIKAAAPVAAWGCSLLPGLLILLALSLLL